MRNKLDENLKESQSKSGAAESRMDDGIITSLVISAVLALVVLSYRDWFFFVPILSNGLNAISVIQIFSTVGWVSLILIPPFMIYQERGFAGSRGAVFLGSALLWPLATVLIALVTFATFGKFYLDYLAQSPIFFFMDILAPAYYVLFWRSRRD